MPNFNFIALFHKHIRLRQWRKFISPECCLVHCAVVKLTLLLMNNNLCISLILKLRNTTDMVKMSVCAYNILYLQAVPFYYVNYPVGFIARVYDHGFSGLFIRNNKTIHLKRPDHKAFYEHIIPPLESFSLPYSLDI